MIIGNRITLFFSKMKKEELSAPLSLLLFFTKRTHFQIDRKLILLKSNIKKFKYVKYE